MQVCMCTYMCTLQGTMYVAVLNYKHVHIANSLVGPLVIHSVVYNFICQLIQILKQKGLHSIQNGSRSHKGTRCNALPYKIT